uniref:Uncharacterized protein n=1 Tax=Solanum tuberosum TaxID=4113 RepID=M1CGI0_SOLTU
MEKIQSGITYKYQCLRFLERYIWFLFLGYDGTLQPQSIKHEHTSNTVRNQRVTKLWISRSTYEMQLASLFEQ